MPFPHDSVYRSLLIDLHTSTHQIVGRIADGRRWGGPTEELERELARKRGEIRTFIAYLQEDLRVSTIRLHAVIKAEAVLGNATVELELELAGKQGEGRAFIAYLQEDLRCINESFAGRRRIRKMAGKAFQHGPPTEQGESEVDADSSPATNKRSGTKLDMQY